MKDLQLKKSLLSCPGDTIQEHIDYIGMSQAELAKQLGRPISKLNELIEGKAPVTKEIAIELQDILGVPYSFWLNLERIYQDELLEIEQMESLERDQKWVTAFPLKKMKELGLVPNIHKKTELLGSILNFFGVDSPKEWSNIYNGSSLAFKIELKHASDSQAISVWLRLGELQAKKIQAVEFDKKALHNSLKQIQEISYNNSDDWLKELQVLCASCGVFLVYTPCIAKAPIYGATRWIENNSLPLIQITDRHKDYNSFWFTFFHELGHVLFHGKEDMFIDGIDSIEPDKKKEDEADTFAANMLLSEENKKELFKYSSFSKELVLELSEKFKQHPSIIVSQIQRKYEHLYNRMHLNKLKVKVEFTELSI